MSFAPFTTGPQACPSPFQIQIGSQFAAPTAIGAVQASLATAVTAAAQAQLSATAAATSAASALAVQTASAATETADQALVTNAAAAQNAFVVALGADDVSALAYLAATPGATNFAGLPTTLPASSGVWWINGRTVSKS